MKNKLLKNPTQLSLYSFVLSTLLLSPSVKAADFIDLTISDYGTIPSIGHSALGTVVETLEDQINSNFPTIDLVPFTEGAAKSAGIATSGMGPDYASDFGFGYISSNFSIASSATVNQIKDLGTGTASVEDVPGIGGSIALTLGLSFKHIPKIPVFGDIFEPSRTRGYLSFYSGGKSFNADNPVSPDFKIGSSIFAAQGQYKLVEGMSVGLGTFKWGGVDVSLLKIKRHYYEITCRSFNRCRRLRKRYWNC
jgi:hypothetical protein